jgi:TldD protein
MKAGSLIDKCMDRGVEYADCTSITYKKLRVDCADGQSAINRYADTIYVLKVLWRGRWGVCASTKLGDEVLDEALRRASTSAERDVRLAQRRPVQGGFVIGQGRPIADSDGLEVVDFLDNVSKSLRELFSDVQGFEAVVEAMVTTRAMISSDGVNAYEVKPSVVGCFVARSRGGDVATLEVFGSGSLEVLWRADSKRIAEELAFQLQCASRSKVLNPLYKGSRFEVVLSPEAASKTVQAAVEHALNAKSRRSLAKRGHEGLTVLDDPTLEGGYGSFFFDDEGVRARRKKLIESGRVVSLLHNRETAYLYGVEPTGNGRGLAVPPQPLHGNLVVEPGDWKVDEVVEETKLGFLVHSAKRSYVTGDLLVVEPEVSFLVVKGEVREPARLNCLAVDVREFFSSVRAVASGPMGSAREVVFGCEVASYSPSMKLEMRAF